MSLYPDSSQRREWVLTPTQLAQRRSNGASRYAQEILLSNPAVLPTDIMTDHEQYQLFSYYQRRISEYGSAFSLPIGVVGTAVVFFKRFYLNRTVMDEDPRLIAVSALLLATKAEEAHIRVSDLAKTTAISTELLLKFEQILLDGISFHLKVHTPFRAVQGLVNLIPDLSKSEMKNRIELADIEVMNALYTDAIFLYTPSQIALACVERTASNLSSPAPGKDIFSMVLERSQNREDADKLKAIVKTINEIIDESVNSSSKGDLDEFRKLKNKRDQCRNLFRDPTSDLY
uniref:Cyclin-like domain-containing protein n=1 Tax=Spongospora subterranea TaxID=70186 RepID=A0A0H5R9D4_9EUKA|eukprot:CRZ05024.1 hypothetical protein [Spongospora subterranea]